MNDFTKELAQGLFNQEKLNETLRKLMQAALNELLESELTAFLGYDPYERDAGIPATHATRLTIARSILSLEKLKLRSQETEMATFSNILYHNTNSAMMLWKPL